MYVSELIDLLSDLTPGSKDLEILCEDEHGRIFNFTHSVRGVHDKLDIPPREFLIIEIESE